MEIKLFQYNDWFELIANGYLIIDDFRNCFVIDPGKNNDNIKEYINQNGLKLLGILLTHGHFDHIGGVNRLVKTYKVPLYINEKDKDYLTNPKFNCSDRFSRENVVVTAIPTFIKEGETIKGLTEDIKVIETPFHTPGSVCFYLKDSGVLFTGDTLFDGSIGRTDFPGSNPQLISSSLRKIITLPEETIIYPGHNNESTIGKQKTANPFVKI